MRRRSYLENVASPIAEGDTQAFPLHRALAEEARGVAEEPRPSLPAPASAAMASAPAKAESTARSPLVVRRKPASHASLASVAAARGDPGAHAEAALVVAPSSFEVGAAMEPPTRFAATASVAPESSLPAESLVAGDGEFATAAVAEPNSGSTPRLATSAPSFDAPPAPGTLASAPAAPRLTAAAREAHDALLRASETFAAAVGGASPPNSLARPLAAVAPVESSPAARAFGASAQGAGGIRVEIGVLEVRGASPPPPPAPAPAIAAPTARGAPIARGYEWRYGSFRG